MSRGRPPTSYMTTDRPHTGGRSTRPGTGRSGRPQTSVSTGPEGSYICAVLESRGVGREVGIAVIDQETGQCSVTQMADTPTYVKTLHYLTLHSPVTILVPESAVSRQALLNASAGGVGSTFYPSNSAQNDTSSILVRCIESDLNTPVTPVKRSHWNDSDGLAYLDKLLVDDAGPFPAETDKMGGVAEATSRSAILTAISGKYYARCAACALFRHLEAISKTSIHSRSLRIRYTPPDGVVMIDSTTSKDLELVQNGASPRSKLSLLGLLDSCVTPMGQRLLRMSILQPLTDYSTIENRLDAVEELVQEEERFYVIVESLKPLKANNIDLDKLLHSFVFPKQSTKFSGPDPQQTETKIAQLLSLRTLLKALPPIRSALSGTSSAHLNAIGQLFESSKLDELTELIHDAINDDLITGKSKLASRNARAFAVKVNRSPLLDVARETYKENINDIVELQKMYNDQYNLSLALKYSASSDYRFEIKKAALESRALPPEFINVVKSDKTITMSTLELRKRNARFSSSLSEVFLMSEAVIDELREDVVQRVADLYRASEALALLDLITSFAKVSISRNYTRPEFTGTLAIKAGRHPVLDQTLKKDLVSNDVYAPDGATFFLIMGPNMSGKSTFLRQVALLSIMAFIGCFVPAEYASFRIHDAILTRLNNNDSVEQNLSTFSAEMRATAFILSLVSDRSLVLVDEVGRGTAPDEGLGMAHAISEALVQSNAVTLFATHFHDLHVTLSHLPSVHSQHFSVSVKNEVGEHGYGLDFHHRLVDGASNVSHYGLRVAQLAQLPMDLFQNALRIAKLLVKAAQEAKQASGLDRVVRRRKICMKTHAQLQEILRTSTLPEVELRRSLERVQRGVIMVLDEIYREEEVQPAQVSEADAEARPDQDTIEDLGPACGHHETEALQARGEFDMEVDDEAMREAVEWAQEQESLEVQEAKSGAATGEATDERGEDEEEPNEMWNEEPKEAGWGLNDLDEFGMYETLGSAAAEA